MEGILWLCILSSYLLTEINRDYNISFSAIFTILLREDDLSGDSDTSKVYLGNMGGHFGLSQ